MRGTKGVILSLLRGAGRTVVELANELGLTGNAIRGHLAALQRDQLVEVREVRRGPAKPSLVYALTPAGESLFPKAHAVVIAAMLEELRSRLAPADQRAFLRGVATRLTPAASASTLDARLNAAREAFAALGGAAEIERTEDGYRIGCHDCPLGDVTSEHAEVCEVAREVVGGAMGATLETKCTRGRRPSCHFVWRTDHGH
jgi:predicted ArsR family transcriptional regulator